MTAPGLPDPMDKLDRLAALGNGWNGPKSLGPSSESIDTARRVVTLTTALRECVPRLVAQPVPTDDGGICLIWAENGWNVEVGIARDGKIDVWAHHKASGRTITYPPEVSADDA